MKSDDEICNFPCFFKIIISPRHVLQKLEIPRKFVETHGEKLSEVAYLKTPTEAVWKVDVERENNRVWFQNGWPEFVKFYSIWHGHFLMFTYEGNSHFNVIIFDMSASEIEYPAVVHKRKTTSSKVGSKRKMSSDDRIFPASSSKEHQQVKTDRDRGVNPKIVFGGRCILTQSEAKRVEEYRSEHPTFVVRAPLSYVESKFIANLPAEFVRRYLPKQRGMFRLRNSAGKTWSVKCADMKIKHKKNPVTFNKGWKKFAVENGLQVGDICIFKLIKGVKKLFIVDIIHVARNKLEGHHQAKEEID